MFLEEQTENMLGLCFPRARGDVPVHGKAIFPQKKFSPRTRGCSGKRVPPSPRRGVFPAHAGMFREERKHENHGHCFPRARGDVPLNSRSRLSPQMFSPRTRGCSPRLVGGHRSCRVFPAHAGMFRKRPTVVRPPRRFPRARGDVPDKERKGTIMKFVFPAHAGMFRVLRVFCLMLSRFPRARGDVPTHRNPRGTLNMFSPRTRGCS